MTARRVIILGSTGSIGTQAISAIQTLNRAADAGKSAERYEVVGLAAGTRADELVEQASSLGVRELALADERAALPGGVSALRGPDAAERLVRSVDADIVVASVVGVAGLASTLAAVELGRDVALANKETLVAAGSLVTHAASNSGARMFAVDSEHAAAWQCLSGLPGAGPHCPWADPPPALHRLILTASGGPFRSMSSGDLERATPEQALAHPTWSMGAKVTIDSATLTNKAFELIEAHWLFGLRADQLAAVVHPQSTVHAMAELTDGSVIAQLAVPDMRLAIAQAIGGGRTPATIGLPDAPGSLDIGALSSLTFEEPDHDRFPALAQAARVIETGGTAGAVFNAANEEAVNAFLDRRIGFASIARLTIGALDAHRARPVASLGDVMDADAEGRAFVRERANAAPEGV